MTIVPDVKLDVRGEKCPYPRIRTLQQIKTLKKGEILEVLTLSILGLTLNYLLVWVEKKATYWKGDIDNAILG